MESEPDRTRAWKTLSSQVVFSHRYFPTVMEDTVELPTGEVQVWLRYRDERDGAPLRSSVAAIVVGDDGRVVLARQYCHGPRRVIHEFPGGTVEPGESLAEGVAREVAEEVGLRPRTVKTLGEFLLDNRRSSATMTVFECRDLEPSHETAHDSGLIEFEWVSGPELTERIRAGEITNVTLLASWAIYKARQDSSP